jgi:hypothetical protein
MTWVIVIVGLTACIAIASWDRLWVWLEGREDSDA